MCSQRVLCRLRLISNARKRSKQCVSEVLQNAIQCFEQLGKQKLDALFQSAMAFTKRAKRVIQLVASWTKHQTMHQLSELVEEVYQLQKIGDLKHLLATIPNRMMDPSSRENLVNIIGKVARYREAAHFFHRTAKKYPLVRRMKVVLANLPESFFDLVPTNIDTSNLASTIINIGAEYRKSEVSYICRLLNTTESQANGTIATQTRKTMTEAKIHAEIQLLYYCELNNLGLPPRVICSSKDACYLCNAFIMAYGKMHIPRYHGRLYPGWRLPLSSALKATELKFNSALDEQLRKSLHTLVSKRRKTIYPDPNESTILTLATSTSTLRSSLLSRETNKELRTVQSPTKDTVVHQDSSGASSVSTVRAPLETTSTTGCATGNKSRTLETGTNAESLPENDNARNSFPRHSRSSQPMPLGENNSDVVALVQGKTLACNVAVGIASPFYVAGSLETQIEYPIEEAMALSGGSASDIACRLEWIKLEEADRLYEHRAASIVDVAALQGDSTYELDSQNCLFLVARGVLMKINLRLGSPDNSE
jgi:hypothetical protein